MLVLCYPVLVSLAFAAPGVSRSCYDYCNTKVSNPMEDASLECDCADYIDTVIESEESSVIILDDTGVYFVPAETHSFQGQFSSRPFFISNPAKLIPKTRNRINREFVTLKEPLNNPAPSPSAHVEIYKRTETISHTRINQDLEKSPLYLDIDIQETTGKDRAAVQQGTFIDDFESTELDLVGCLDFQVVQYTRKYGFIEKFREFWTARNLDKYEHWSDLDIEQNIQKWCSTPDLIVQHSLQEIKQGLPKKVHSSRSNQIENQFTDAENSTKLVTSTSLHNNATERAVAYNKSTEGYTSPQNITEIYDTTYDPTEDWPFISVTSSPTLKEGNLNQIQKSSSPEEAVSGTPTITTDNTLTKDNPKEITIEANQPIGITTSDSEMDLDTMASEDVFYPYVPTVTEVKIIDDSYHLDDHSSILQNPTITPLSTEEFQERESSVTGVNILDGQSLNENNTLAYDTSQFSVTAAYPELRDKYEEKEIRIPKIITKECQNNTIQTTIDGFEELPNNDFKDSRTQNLEIDNEDGGLDIRGRLYFVYKRQLVPMHFVQTNTGAVSLGVDGPALCDKLVLKPNKKSQLFTVLCEYLQSNTNQNKISSAISN